MYAPVLFVWVGPGLTTPSALSRAAVSSAARRRSAPAGKRSAAAYTSIIGIEDPSRFHRDRAGCASHKKAGFPCDGADPADASGLPALRLAEYFRSVLIEAWLWRRRGVNDNNLAFHATVDTLLSCVAHGNVCGFWSRPKRTCSTSPDRGRSCGTPTTYSDVPAMRSSCSVPAGPSYGRGTVS